MISGIELTPDNSLLELLRSAKKGLKDAMDKNDPDLLASQLAAAAQELRNNSKKETLAIANSSGCSMMSSHFASSGGTSESTERTLNVFSARKK